MAAEEDAPRSGPREGLHIGPRAAAPFCTYLLLVDTGLSSSPILLADSLLADCADSSVLPPPPFIMAQANVFIVIYRLHGSPRSLTFSHSVLAYRFAIFLFHSVLQVSYVKDRGCTPCDYVEDELSIVRRQH